MKHLHRAWAEIDLDALIHNFTEIKKSTKAKVCCVVKANAYGHSVDPIAKLLEKSGADLFAVSNIDEARELRELGIKIPIIILGYTPVSFADELVRYRITQTVFSFDYAQKLSLEAEKLGKVIEGHLKLDTGMGRLGFDCRSERLNGLTEIKQTLLLNGLDFNGIFTHFSSADSYAPLDREETSKQYERFIRVVEILQANGTRFEMRHCCNSAATMLYPEMHLDAIRPGIILYGLTPSADIEPTLNLKPVMSFKSTISMVKTLDKDQTVSYGRTYKAKNPIKIATISVGYADGMPRILSGKGRVLVKGKEAAIVGRVCMDQMCIDVTDIADVKEGDIVTLFGEGLPVERLAKEAETINYEIVCGLSKRVQRFLVKNGQEIDN